MNEIEVEGRKIGVNNPPFIIAELSCNHNQDLDRAMAIVDSAADAGCDAIKLQTSRPDLLTLDSQKDDFIIKGSNPDWEGQTLFELYKTAYTPWEWHEPLFKRAREKGMIPFSASFGLEAVDFLEELGNPIHKVASFENNWPDLIKRIAETGKPVIISTGMADLETLQNAVDIIRSTGNEKIILLKCTSNYPATCEEMNLKTIPDLRDQFDVEVGLSDHTLGITVPVASVVMGASVVEKHLTLNRDDGGLDSSFSIEPDEMKNLVTECKNAWRSIGDVHYGPTSSEESSIIFRRSIYVAQDVKTGDKFTEDNIKVVRPGYGLDPKHYQDLLGKVSNKDFEAGDRLTPDVLS